MKAYEDPDNKGNSIEYHTGKECINIGCPCPAGTAWSPHWCFRCNVERMKIIDEQLKVMMNRSGIGANK